MIRHHVQQVMASRVASGLSYVRSGRFSRFWLRPRGCIDKENKARKAFNPLPNDGPQIDRLNVYVEKIQVKKEKNNCSLVNFS